MSHYTEKWSKIWRKTDFGLENDMNFFKFLAQHLKISKLGLSWDPFIQGRTCMSLKFTEELCAMTMKNDAIFEEELTCSFKIAKGIWQILTWALKSQKFAL